MRQDNLILFNFISLRLMCVAFVCVINIAVSSQEMILRHGWSCLAGITALLTFNRKFQVCFYDFYRYRIFEIREKWVVSKRHRYLAAVIDHLLSIFLIQIC